MPANIGSTTLNSAPLPSPSLRASIVPSCSSTSTLATANPTPSPVLAPFGGSFVFLQIFSRLASEQRYDLVGEGREMVLELLIVEFVNQCRQLWIGSNFVAPP